MMEETDERFAAISSDPRFKSIPKRERKVKIDRRFEAMFKDKKFKLRYSIDKRGRPLQHTTDESLKRFYEMSDSEDSDSEGDTGRKHKSLNEKKEENESIKTKSGGRENDETGGVNNKIKIKPIMDDCEESKSGRRKKRRSGREELRLLIQKKQNTRNPRKETEILKRDKKPTDDESSDENEPCNEADSEMKEPPDDDSSDESEPRLYETRQEMKDGGNDNVKQSEESEESSSSEDSSSDEDIKSGKVDYSRGKAFMESSSSDESDSEGNDDVDLEHTWGEIDTEAPRNEEISSRLAVCNMDWDRITSRDILVMLSSFKPTNGIIKSVKIFISDLGFERMKDEDVHGPKELVEKDEKFDKLGELAEKKYFREKLRKYQLQRLKYYYAIAECDSKETANHIYEQCDNFEFESSAVKLDLRFIPDDMTFDRAPKQVTESDSLDLDLYKPSEFVNSALQQSKVDLTWDEDDPERLRNAQEAFKKDELEIMDLKTYLASGSEEEDSNKDNDSEDEEGLSHMTEEERLEKYRTLVRGLDKEQEEDDVDAEMEITWEPGLKEATEELVAKKLEKDPEKSRWQQYVDKKKEKIREMKKKEKIEKQRNKELESDGEVAFSDDELPEGVDVNDSFFSSVDDRDGKKNKKNSKRKHNQSEEEDDPEKQKKKAELELLMMDDEDHKQHFNLKDIMEQEKPKKKKKRKKTKGKEDDIPKEDNFELDVKDSRFDAIYTSHHFAIDPSDPHFKRTKAMESIMDEKQSRRMKGDQRITKTHQKVNKESHDGTVSKTEVSALIKSIKRNTGNLKSKSKKK